MVLRWILLVFQISLGLAQNNCSRIVFPAPVFGAGDNLSAEGCGIWDKQKYEVAPWSVVVSRSGGGGCRSTLISPTSLLTDFCQKTAEAFSKSENKEEWKAVLGKCVLSSEEAECVENGHGQILKIKSVNKLNAPGHPIALHIWKIEKATLKENYIAPICLSNKGNGQDFEGTMQQYTAFNNWWDNSSKVSAQLKEDFGPCLNQSGSCFKTCEKVHENFLCFRLLKEGPVWIPYLTHEKKMALDKTRHFLRAIQAESIQSSAKFYYEIFPLLQEITLLTGDIPLEPKISAKN